MFDLSVIFEELKTRIRRGETHEPFAGAELYYSGSRVKEEVVKINGRLRKDVNILVCQGIPSIRYLHRWG